MAVIQTYYKTHGYVSCGKEVLKFSDNGELYLHDLLKPIIESSILRHLPKMFFIQSCRSVNNKFGGKFTDKLATPWSHNCLFFYACARGYNAVTSRYGSLFIKYLAGAISSHGEIHDVVKILTAVNAQMEKHATESQNDKKVIFCSVVEQTLTKQIYFHAEKQLQKSDIKDTGIKEMERVTIGDMRNPIMNTENNAIVARTLRNGKMLGIRWHKIRWPTKDDNVDAGFNSLFGNTYFSKYSEQISSPIAKFNIVTSFEEHVGYNKQYIGIMLELGVTSAPVKCEWTSIIVQDKKVILATRKEYIFRKGTRHGTWFKEIVRSKSQTSVFIAIKMSNG